MLLLIAGRLAGFAPRSTVFDDPIRQSPLETDVVAGLFRLNPLVAENLLPLRLKFTIK